MMSLLVREDRNKIAHVRMNAAAMLNALSDEMVESLQNEFDSMDDSIHVIILSGEGKAFCAGHNLKEMLQESRTDAAQGRKAEFCRNLFRKCSILMQTIQNMPQPVIAQVHGVATAAGCQLVATCDLAVASSETRLGVNGVNLGLFCATPMVALTRTIQRKHAFEMLTTGRLISASEALSMGLVNRVVPYEELNEATYDLAETIASKLPSAIRLGKQSFYKQADMSTDDAYDCTGEIMVENLMSSDTQEGIAAFLEKRTPDWSS